MTTTTPILPVRTAVPIGRRGQDDGSALVEILGIIPIAVIVAGFIFQMFLIGFGSIRAESSARLAAREASLGSNDAQIRSMIDARARYWDPQVQIASGDLPDDTEPGLEPTGDPDAVSAKVTVTVPLLGFNRGFLTIHLTRHAVMPKTG